MVKSMTIKWNSLNSIAAHKGCDAPFPDELPNISVCDFDEIKNSCCIHRAGKLCSVDTVLPGKDGRLYFVEFKDATKNRIAKLKKKAFDSLAIFWMTLGREESMASICSRSVFLYVKPNSESKKPPSVAFLEEMLFRDSGNLQLAKSRNGNNIGNWLNDFKVEGLYFDVEELTTSNFIRGFSTRFETGEDVGFISGQTMACSAMSMNFRTSLERMSLNKLFTKARLDVGGGSGDFCADGIEAVDFRRLSERLLKNRMYLPNENLIGSRKEMFEVMVALKDKRLYTYHNWDKMQRPLGHLVNCIFDSSYLFAWIISPHLSFTQAVENLSAVIVYEGDFVELKRSASCVWLQEFYDNYIKWFNGEIDCDRWRDVKFGLGSLIMDGLYNRIITTKELPMPV